MPTKPRFPLAGGRALALAFASIATHAHADLFVGGYDTPSRIGTYSATTGAPINASLATTPSIVEDIALFGNTLYVTDASVVRTFNATTGALLNPNFTPGAFGIEVSGNTLYVPIPGGNVRTYDATTGALLNASFISVSGGAVYSIKVSGNDLYLGRGSSVGKYDATTGAVLNAAFVTGGGLATVEGIDVLGNSLYVGSAGSGLVGIFDATTGTAINANFITGLGSIWDVVIGGNNLYVANLSKVLEYDAIGGVALNANFITGRQPTSLAISNVPEPSSALLLFVLGSALPLLLLRRRAAA